MIHFDFRGEYPESSFSSFRRSRNYRGPFTITASFTTFEIPCLIAKDWLELFKFVHRGRAEQILKLRLRSKSIRKVRKFSWDLDPLPVIRVSNNRIFFEKGNINRVLLRVPSFSSLHAINRKMRRNNGWETFLLPIHFSTLIDFSRHDLNNLLMLRPYKFMRLPDRIFLPGYIYIYTFARYPCCSFILPLLNANGKL